jgi:DNA-binding NtrC family response regulator
MVSMPTSSGKRNVLIVDDDPSVAETLELIISRQGHETRVAPSAEEAFVMIATWQPDLAVLDVMLPGISGIEFAKMLRNIDPECEIVLVSGHPGADELVEIARTQGQALSFLPKPLDPVTILAIASGQSPGSAEKTDA